MSELGVNKVVLIGRSGGDAELRYTAGGKPVANFSLAVNESFRSRDGEKKDHLQWFPCVCWKILGRPARRLTSDLPARTRSYRLQVLSGRRTNGQRHPRLPHAALGQHLSAQHLEAGLQTEEAPGIHLKDWIFRYGMRPRCT